MRRVLNFGSLNIDHVYRVPHLVRPGETIGSTGYSRGAGGKGFNQSVALARAGAAVWHLGAVGGDGGWLRGRLRDEGVDISLLADSAEPSGHAVIQVDDAGQNSIVLYPGANHAVSAGAMAAALASFTPGDAFLCQNETNLVSDALRAAKAAGLLVCANPAPCGPEASGYPLECVDLLVVNETEGAELSGASESEDIVTRLRSRYPETNLLLTLGGAGAVYADASGTIAAKPPRVEVVDTTAAGDTFIGFFLAGVLAGAAPLAALESACRAAALCVTRSGAADSIPTAAEAAAFAVNF